MKAIIDRFEGKYAVCELENKKVINIEKSKLPVNTKEGDVITITDDKIIINKEETIKLREDVKELTKDLWN